MSTKRWVREMLDEAERIVVAAGLQFRVDFGGKHHLIVVTDGTVERKTPYTISQRRETNLTRMKLADVRRIVREFQGGKG